MTWLTFLKYTHHRWPRLYSGCCSHSPVHLPSFMTYRRLFNMYKTTGYMYYKSSSFSIFIHVGHCIVCVRFRALNTNWYFHGYVPPVVNTSRSFPHSWLIIRFVTRLTRWVPLVEQELLTIPEHLSSPPLFSGVRVTLSLVLCVCFVNRCLSFCTFSFGHCVVCSSSIYGFWLPLWDLHTLIQSSRNGGRNWLRQSI